MDDKKKHNLVLFNTLKKTLEPFKPIGKKIKIYTNIYFYNMFYDRTNILYNI